MKALSEELAEDFSESIESLVSRKLPPVVSTRCLATLFGYSPRFMHAIYSNPEKYYSAFTIKKGSKKREIQAPRVALKVIQKWIGHHLSEAIKFEDYVCGFVKGKSAIDGAEAHCGATWVYSVDIENFFPTTPMSMVIKSLVELGYPQSGAEILAKICSYNECLPQGSPASPVLSNIVFRKADSELKGLAEKYDLKYTRYADDVVFSGVDEFPEPLKDEVKAIIEAGGWVLSAHKEHLARLPNRLKVFGLLVSGKQPRLTKGYRNKIRAYQHLLKKGNIKDEDMSRVKGHLSYAKFIEEYDPEAGKEAAE